MPSRPILAATLIALAATLAGCANGVPTEATVATIDHTCEIIEKVSREVKDPRGGGGTIEATEQSSRKGECKSVGEWKEVRSKRNKQVEGTADVHVTYRAPDGSFQTGTVTYTGRDDEFYELKAGDPLKIMVDAEDPKRIWKA
ncbi:hypothetical protein [Sphingomonas arenae]|uniref:hypothetical protein n=1 Tax=Sphingomonas arenae TaxID=2812555 RepID=UPI001967A6CA|nr:hypothetical protein [Sphingomonas arenae]